MSRDRVNKWADFAERVIWTCIQAGAAAALVTGFDDWNLTLKVAGTAALGAALKVIVGQNTGNDNSGAVAPGVEVVKPTTNVPD